MERFAKLAVQALNQVLEKPIDTADLEVPKDPKLGDFAFPCFKLAKEFRKAPAQVATQMVADLHAKQALPAGIEVSATGPYVNFLAPQKEVMQGLLGDILAGPGNGTYGKLAANTRGSWVIEYSSPNVAKPFQVYHFRPTGLGAALDRVGRFRGFKVTSINHLGDWGTQYGKLSVAFKLYGADLPADPSINDLVGIYVKFHTAVETNPALEDEARAAFRRLEQDDPEMIALWKKCVEISMKEFNKLYARLNVKFDHVWGESHYKAMLAPLMAELRKKDLLIQSEGAWIVPVTDADGKELPPCIVEKSDGGSIYATRDLAAAIYRHEQFHFDRMTYVVGGEQKLHFQQVFAVLRKMGFDWASKCEHVPTGLYRFKDAKMSTRKGNFVTFDEVLTLAKERVTTLMSERAAAAAPGTGATYSPSELEQITEAVALGAVVFHDLHGDPARDVEFDVERVVDFEGETGPYLQYAHTRCVSILRKAAEAGYPAVAFDESLIPLLKAPEELALVKVLGQFPLHMERTLTQAKASQLAHFLVDVTQSYGAFYRECHVLGQSAGGSPELTRGRLMLVEATRRILAQGLTLIGIPLPEKM
ncbi:MAG: arginine--tRNA ligase [Methylotenera sp.]|nr:arginine--tRNA ligase [Oligoflexia bacterium]